MSVICNFECEACESTGLNLGTKAESTTRFTCPKCGGTGKSITGHKIFLRLKRIPGVVVVRDYHTCDPITYEDFVLGKMPVPRTPRTLPVIPAMV